MAGGGDVALLASFRTSGVDLHTLARFPACSVEEIPTKRRILVLRSKTQFYHYATATAKKYLKRFHL